MPIKIENKEDLLSVIQSQANKMDEMEQTIKALQGNDNSNEDDKNNGSDDKDKTDTSDLDFLFD